MSRNESSLLTNSVVRSCQSSLTDANRRLIAWRAASASPELALLKCGNNFCSFGKMASSACRLLVFMTRASAEARTDLAGTVNDDLFSPRASTARGDAAVHGR